MRELKLKEVNDKYRTLIEEGLVKGVHIKPFLTISELNTIISDMKETQKEIKDDGTKVDTEKPKSALARHFTKIIFMVDFCTNLDISDMSADEVYDLASELGLIEVFKVQIEVYNDIDEMIKSDESTYTLIKDITDKFAKTLEGKDANGNGFMDAIMQAKDVMNGVNK